MKQILTLAFLFSSNYLFAQKIGIHNTNPTAALDISGAVTVRPIFFNITSSALTATNDIGAVVLQQLVSGLSTFNISKPSATNGQNFLIDNLSAYMGMLGSTAVVPIGLSEYIYSNSSWKLLTTNNTEPFKWSLLGNAGINPLINFVGTNDVQPLPFYMFNSEKMKLTTAGLQIKNAGFVEMGSGYSKEINAGRIGYELFTTQTLDVYGAGTLAADRKIKFWAEEKTTFEGGAFFKKDVGISSIATDGKLQINSSTASIATIAIRDSLANSAGHISFRTVSSNVRGMSLKVNSTGTTGNLNNMSLYAANNTTLATHIFHGNGHTEIKGKIDIADDIIAPVAGTIRYNTTTQDFEGYNGTIWLSMTVK
jgi:hypothetical protein